MFEVLVDHEFGNVEAIGGNMSLELERERGIRESVANVVSLLN